MMLISDNEEDELSMDNSFFSVNNTMGFLSALCVLQVDSSPSFD
jgi:hypothetical protein